MTLEYSTPARRPLLIHLHGIGPNTDETAPNIVPLSKWDGFSCDVASIPWNKGAPGQPGYPLVFWEVAHETYRLQQKYRPSTTVYIGHSTGALVALRTAVKAARGEFSSPEHGQVDGVVGIHGVYNLSRYEEFSPNVPALFNLWLHGSPDMAPHQLRRVNNCETLNVDIPLFLAHGDADRIVAYEQSSRMGPTYCVPGADHGFNIDDYPDLFKSIKQFVLNLEVAALENNDG